VAPRDAPKLRGAEVTKRVRAERAYPGASAGPLDCLTKGLPIVVCGRRPLALRVSFGRVPGHV
jgi:hypothetical protein